MKPNYKTTFAALALLSIASASAGEAVTLTWKRDAPANAQTAVLTLAAGESAKVKWGGAGLTGDPNLGGNFDGIRLNLTVGETTRIVGLFNGNTPVGFVPLEVSGPATIAVFASGTSYDFAIATFEVTRPASPSVTPSNAAVIPVDANGTFTVILESSTDLITWTAANPGDYSGNTVKRFFRSRIVKK